MGFAFIARETVENYEWLLSQMRDLNGGIEPKVILTDFEIPICEAVEKTYVKTTHLICQWHMM